MYAEDTTSLGYTTQMTLTESDLKASFLWFSSHSSRKYCANCQGREAMKRSYPLQHLWIITITSMARYEWKCKKWHSHVGGSHQCLTGLQAHSTEGKSCQYWSGKPTQLPRACEVMDLKRSLLPPLCYTSIIPSYALNLILTSTGKSSHHPHQRNFSTANGDHHRRPQDNF